MGRGNWYPGTDLSTCRVCYVDFGIDVEDEDADYLITEAYDNLPVLIEHDMRRSFRWFSPGDYREYKRHSPYDLQRDDGVLAENGLYQLVTDCQGDHYHQGVGLVLRNDAPAFALSQMDRTWDKILKCLAASWEVSLRRCAWTCTRFTLEKETVSG